MLGLGSSMMTGGAVDGNHTLSTNAINSAGGTATDTQTADTFRVGNLNIFPTLSPGCPDLGGETFTIEVQFDYSGGGSTYTATGEYTKVASSGAFYQVAAEDLDLTDTNVFSTNTFPSIAESFVNDHFSTVTYSITYSAPGLNPFTKSGNFVETSGSLPDNS